MKEKKMNIWLDDQWDDPERPKRWPPKGFIPVKNLAEVEALMERDPRKIGVMDFDHDLADFDEDGRERTGLTIIEWLYENQIDRYPEEIEVHSDNSVGRDNIRGFDTNVRKYVLSQI